MIAKSKADSRLRRSVYSEARLKEISQAVVEWFQGLTVPRNAMAKRITGASHNAIHHWRNGKGVRPVFMYALWKNTGNSVFLLTKEEYQSWTDRNREIPADFPTLEEFQLEKSGPSKEVVPQTAVSKMLTASLAILLGALVQIETLTANDSLAVSSQMRTKTAGLILRLVKAMSLKSEDFKKTIQAETDPAVLREWEKFLKQITGR